ncbi:MAG: ATP-binding protein [Deltaproteobacteria bacterium]|nr:ATP-binding protein [Deltaproteobacteria bacterium]
MALYLGTSTSAPTVPPAEGAPPPRTEIPPKHLTTHGLIFGMTGSGKTGLAIVLLEEAQRAGIPIIAIDPKGDLGNIALAWPGLGPAEFATWVDPAKKEGAVSPLDLGAQLAEQWRGGLAKSGLGPDDIAAMRKKSAVAVYTPGSTAGIPVSLLAELSAPPEWGSLPDEDRSELVSGLVAALLALVDVSADPLQSKEAILVATLVLDAWNKGESLDLPRLVQRIDNPPVTRFGVYEIDEFLPPKKRKDLALQLNGLVASPAFQAWRQGGPIDVARMFGRENGASRTSIFSIAHLDDSQRYSFVTLLLERIIAWMRAQPGSGDLRALLYMDEVFGYLPPHPANPPTKRPLMTLMKQARAFGLGVVLATQNPVDVDYKALTNAGTWLIGKLQTDQDKERVLDGLMSASAAGTSASTRGDISKMISALEQREFVLQDANLDGPRTFKSRWAMSYLRGPMTRQEIGRLLAAGFYNDPAVRALVPERVAAPEPPRAPAPIPEASRAPAPRPAPSDLVVGDVVELGPPVSSTAAAPRPWSSDQPVSPGWPVGPTPAEIPGLEARYRDAAALRRDAARALFQLGALPTSGAVLYRPALYAEAHVTYRIPNQTPLHGGVVRRVVHPLPTSPGSATWRSAEAALEGLTLQLDPESEATLSPPPRWMHSPADRERAKDVFLRELVRTQRARVPACPPLGVYGQPGETIEDFKSRLAPKLGQATGNAVARRAGQRDQLQERLQRQVDEMKELLMMDQRELAMLRERGDPDLLRKAELRARVRMDKFKELKATRDKFGDIAAREVADIEFAALDKLEACTYVDLVLEPSGVQLVFFGLLWVPNR